MKKKIFVIVLFMILVMPFYVLAGDLKLSYEKVFDINTNNEGFLEYSYDNKGNINGYYYDNTRYNLKDEILFTKEDEDFIPSNVSIETVRIPDGFCNTLVTVNDDNGNLVWKKEYGNSLRYDIAIDSIVNSFNDAGEVDGYIFHMLTTSSFTDALQRDDMGIFEIKIDLSGNILWKHSIYFNNNFFLYDENDNFKALVVFQESNLFKLTTYNETIISNDISTDYEINNVVFSYDSDGKADGFIICGTLNQETIVVKYDFEGNEIFRKTYGDSYFKILESNAEDGSLDGYIAYGMADGGNGNAVGLIRKYNFDGEMVWQATYGNDDFFRVNFDYVIKSYDINGKFNGYLVSGINDNTCSVDVDNDCSSQRFILKYTYGDYPIEKKDETGGVIEVNDRASAGEVVKVKIDVKEGYVVKRIIVKDEAGNEIEVSSDGTFVMPEGKVTVSAIYERITNPDTVSACYIVLGIVLIISIGTLIITKQKKIND